MKKLRIAIDFDGTIVSQAYPKIGVLMYGAKYTIRKWRSDGHIVTINTCRSNQFENDAIKFLKENNIEYDFINENDPALISQYNTDCRKISADLYLDDKNFGGFIGWDNADLIVEQMQSQKPLIICLVGESATGKTAMAEHFEKEYGIKMIESYTDRAKRTPDEVGHTFLSRSEFDKLYVDDMIAFTDFGDKRYCCLKEDVQSINTYVIDEAGLKMLRKLYSNDYVIKAIRLRCDEKERRRRGGDERVNRDKGRFTMHSLDFDCEIDTNQPKSDTFLVGNIYINKFIHEWNKYDFRSLIREAYRAGIL
jgi:guanylate kinase